MAKNTKLVTLLKNARCIVAGGWIQDALAEDKMGNEVTVTSPKAVSFCAVGALRRAEYELGTQGVATVARRTLRSVLPKNRSIGGGSVISFNDRANKKDVLKLFDRAIAKVSK